MWIQVFVHSGVALRVTPHAVVQSASEQRGGFKRLTAHAAHPGGEYSRGVAAGSSYKSVMDNCQSPEKLSEPKETTARGTCGERKENDWRRNRKRVHKKNARHAAACAEGRISPEKKRKKDNARSVVERRVTEREGAASVQAVERSHVCSLLQFFNVHFIFHTSSFEFASLAVYSVQFPAFSFQFSSFHLSSYPAFQLPGFQFPARVSQFPVCHFQFFMFPVPSFPRAIPDS